MIDSHDRQWALMLTHDGGRQTTASDARRAARYTNRRTVTDGCEFTGLREEERSGRGSYLTSQLTVGSGARLGQTHERNSSVDNTPTASCRPGTVLLCFISWRQGSCRGATIAANIVSAAVEYRPCRRSASQAGAWLLVDARLNADLQLTLCWMSSGRSLVIEKLRWRIRGASSLCPSHAHFASGLVISNREAMVSHRGHQQKLFSIRGPHAVCRCAPGDYRAIMLCCHLLKHISLMGGHPPPPRRCLRSSIRPRSRQRPGLVCSPHALSTAMTEHRVPTGQRPPRP